MASQSDSEQIALIGAQKKLGRLLAAIEQGNKSECTRLALTWKHQLLKTGQAERARALAFAESWIAQHANGNESLLREYLGIASSPQRAAAADGEQSAALYDGLADNAFAAATAAESDAERDKAVEALVANIAHLPPVQRSKWEQRAIKQRLITRRNLDVMLRAADQAQKPAADEEKLESHERYAIQDGVHLTIELLQDGGRHKRPLCNFLAWILYERALDDGQEIRRRLVIAGHLKDGARLPECEIDESEFAAMNWVMKHWGVRAVVRAGSATRDKLREAIQLNSIKCSSQTIYTHTGWRVIDGQRVFLTSTGALGLPDVTVKLSGNLARYSLPTDLSGAPARRAMLASLRLLYAAKNTVSVPLWSAMYLAPLCELVKPAFSIFVHGQSGSLKSSYVAAALSHFGDFDHKTLPESWESSENALKRHAFVLKDLPFVIDDFAPQASSNASQQLENNAARILRSAGNLSARNRLKADASDNPGTPPRSLIISTGEHLPSGESVIARTLPLECLKDENGEPVTIFKSKLASAQADRWLTSYAMAGYILWLRDHWEKLEQELPERINARRHKLQGKTHLRSPEMFAQILTAFDLAIDYAVSTGAVTAAKAKAYKASADQTMKYLAETQARHISAERPSKLYLDTLQDLFCQGKVYLLPKGESPDAEQRQRSEFLGWYDADYLYLLAGPSHRAVVSFCSQAGITFCLKPPSLWKMLESEKVLERGSEADRRMTDRVDNQRVVRLVRKLAPIWGPTP